MPTTEAKRICLTATEAGIEIKPQDYLGAEFAAFRAAVYKGGGRWTGKVNLAPTTKMSDVVSAMRAAGFEVLLNGQLTLGVAAQACTDAQEAAQQAQAQEDEAGARIAEHEARCGRKLYVFQRDGVRWLSSRTSGILGDEMGLGKTIEALLAMDASKPNMVFCPATLRLNWHAECRAWRPDIKPVVVSKSTFRMPGTGELVIASYESLPDEVE